MIICLFDHRKTHPQTAVYSEILYVRLNNFDEGGSLDYIQDEARYHQAALLSVAVGFKSAC